MKTSIRRPPAEAPDLAAEVARLLEVHRGHWQAIALAADVSYSWLSKFARGKISNPGYATLRRLQSCLQAMPAPPVYARPAAGLETNSPAEAV